MSLCSKTVLKLPFQNVQQSMIIIPALISLVLCSCSYEHGDPTDPINYTYWDNYNWTDKSGELNFPEFDIYRTTSTKDPPIPTIFPPVIIPAEHNHTGTLIFLHDFGRYKDTYEDDLKKFHVPHMKTICISANLDPFLKSGKHYYPTWFNYIEPHYPDNKKGLKYVHNLITEEVKNGIESERIIIGGIYQAGALALHCVITYPMRLGAAVILSPWEPYPMTLDPINNVANKNISIFHGHVGGNLYVTDKDARRMDKRIKKAISHDVQFKIYEGKNITTDEELKDMKQFCMKHVGHI